MMKLKERFEKKELENKYFKFEDDEWVIEEVLIYGYKCNCRNLNTDRERIFNCCFVASRIID